MEECNRSGKERREKISRVHTNKRSSRERRSLLVKPHKYISILEKIPIFKGLKLDQFIKILSICTKQTFSVDETVCLAGEESYQMFILIKGMLKVVFPDGTELSRILPVEVVGEMGVFTGERRSASVVAVEDSIMLSIHKTEIFKLFGIESDLGIRVLMNVIQEISHKLRKNNLIIEELRQMCSTDVYNLILSKIQKESEE